MIAKAQAYVKRTLLNNKVPGCSKLPARIERLSPKLKYNFEKHVKDI